MSDPNTRDETDGSADIDRDDVKSDLNPKDMKSENVSNITEDIMTRLDDDGPKNSATFDDDGRKNSATSDEIELVDVKKQTDMFSTNKVNQMNQTMDQNDVPGLADVLNKLWPPSMVEPKQRKAATLFFIAILILYLIYGLASCVLMINKRMGPSISYTKDIQQTTFESPYWTFCRPLGKLWWEGNENFDLKPYCYLLFSDGTYKECEMEQKIKYTSNGDYCIVLNINEDISAFFPSITIELTLYEPGAPYSWLNYYVSDYEPTDNMNWAQEEEPFDFGWLAMGAEYDLKVMKLANRILDATWGGLKISPKEILTYSTTPRYDRQRDVFQYSTSSLVYYDITLHIWADPQGTQILEEIDPVDSLNLIGSIAGLFGYVTLVFMSVFGTTIYRHMKSMEEQKVQEIIKRVKREALN